MVNWISACSFIYARFLIKCLQKLFIKSLYVYIQRPFLEFTHTNTFLEDTFFIKNQFIGNLVLEPLKIEKLLEVSKKTLFVNKNSLSLLFSEFQ